MISKSKCIDHILFVIPEFSESWAAHQQYWDFEPAGICNDLSAFTRFTVEVIRLDHREMLMRIFQEAEELMNFGDDTVKDAVATCFLESLINIASHGEIEREMFFPYLGQISRQYCDAWDKFTMGK